MIESMDDIYEAWHRELGHAEYRITITMAGYGDDEDAADAFLGGFLDKHPEAGPVVSQDRIADTISVTFSLQASSQDHALKLGQVVWADGGAASGIKPTHVVRLEIEPVGSQLAISRLGPRRGFLRSWMQGGKARIREGALSALKTPANPPAQTKLVPLLQVPRRTADVECSGGSAVERHDGRG